MKKIVYILVISILIGLPAKAQFLKDLKKAASNAIEETSTGFTEEEAGKALKDALTIGIEKGVSRLSKPDGYFKDLQIKIPMPKEAKTVEDKLRMLGQDKAVDDAIKSMNRAAEDAANGAKDVFIAAIKGLTLRDVMNIVNGENDAATRYLENNTRTLLVEKFKPIIKVSLEKVDATKYWNAVFSSYNKLPFVKKVNPDLEDYVTNKAIDGLFVQIAKEELEIRKNPGARVTDLLKKVFG
ncbi:MAG: DUF4197 domain-containing protein [Bacteroidales bacterium]|jgi:hypothetical protein|nr:DUF4197 domain-containing protein [Bacteroidales bacterium]